MYHNSNKKQDIKAAFISAYNLHHLKSTLIDIFPEHAEFINTQLCHHVDQFDVTQIVYNQQERPPLTDLVYNGNQYKQINTLAHTNAAFIKHIVNLLSPPLPYHSDTISGDSMPYSNYPKTRIAGQGPLDTRPTKSCLKQYHTAFGQARDHFSNEQVTQAMAGHTIAPAKSVRFANGYWREGRLKHVDREPVAYSESGFTNDTDIMLDSWYNPSSRVDKTMKDDTSMSFDATNDASVDPTAYSKTFTKRRNDETLPANYSGDYLDNRDYTVPLRDRLPDEAFVDRQGDDLIEPDQGTYDPFSRSIDERNRAMNGKYQWYDGYGKDMRHKQVKDIYRTYGPTPYRAYDLMGGDVDRHHRGPSGTQILPGEAALYNRRYEGERDIVNDDVAERGYRKSAFDMSELLGRLEYRNDNY